MRNAARDAALVGVSAALLFGVQVALAALPNIEMVSLLVIIFSQALGKRTLFVIYVFAMLEGLLYGFGVWWIMYLYVWTLLYFAARLMRRETRALAWALLSGAFGLMFGALCSIPYFFLLGVGGGITYFVSGIVFDLLHCLGNFFLALALYKPLHRAAEAAQALFSPKAGAAEPKKEMKSGIE